MNEVKLDAEKIKEFQCGCYLNLVGLIIEDGFLCEDGPQSSISTADSCPPIAQPVRDFLLDDVCPPCS